MNLLSKTLIAAGAMFGLAMTAAPSEAGVNLSIGIGVPAYYGYDYYRPCEWYWRHDFPAPRRCFDYYRRYWGPGLYIDGDFLFRDRDDYYRWRGRDNYRRWRGHDWRDRGDYGDRGWHNGEGRGDWHGDRGDRGDHGDRGHDRHDRGHGH